LSAAICALVRSAISFGLDVLPFVRDVF
jgi:hypothetical protein